MSPSVSAECQDVDHLDRVAWEIADFLNHPYSIHISGKDSSESSTLAAFRYHRHSNNHRPKHNPYLDEVRSKIRDILLSGVAATNLVSCEVLIVSDDGRRMGHKIPNISSAIEERFVHPSGF